MKRLRSGSSWSWVPIVAGLWLKGSTPQSLLPRPLEPTSSCLSWYSSIFPLGPLCDLRCQSQILLLIIKRISANEGTETLRDKRGLKCPLPLCVVWLSMEELSLPYNNSSRPSGWLIYALPHHLWQPPLSLPLQNWLNLELSYKPPSPPCERLKQVMP